MYKTQILARAVRQLIKYQAAERVLDKEAFCLRLARLQLRLAIELSPKPVH